MGKRFAVFWEQKGCPYCKQMHTVNFARPEINDYVRTHFSVLQLNLRGVREVTDFDGQTLTERALALAVFTVTPAVAEEGLITFKVLSRVRRF